MHESHHHDSDPTRSRLAGRIRALLDDSVQHYDAAALAKLHAARNRAVLQAEKRTHRLPRYAWPGAGLAATATLLAVLLLPFDEERQAAPDTPLAMEDIDLLMAGEELEEIEQMDFFDWLAAHPDAS